MVDLYFIFKMYSHEWVRTFCLLLVEALFIKELSCPSFNRHVVGRQAATPLSCHCLLTREFERVGLLLYRAMLDPRQWKEAYFVLQKSNLFICPRNDGAAEDIINLNRLQELSQCPGPGSGRVC